MSADDGQQVRAGVAFLRRHLLLILFASLVVLQVLTWREVYLTRRAVDGISVCGDRYNPCAVRIEK